MPNLMLPPNPFSDLLTPDIDSDVVKIIRIACPHRHSGQAAVLITWDNMGAIHSSDAEALTASIPGVQASGFARRPESARLLALPHDDLYPSRLQGWIEETAWALGAGYMCRWSQPPCDLSNAGLRHSFGDNMYTICGEPLARGDVSHPLLDLAARSGYWQWEINSAYRKADGHTRMFFASWRKHDPSLEEDGARRSIWPGWHPSRLDAIGQTYEQDIAYNMVTRRVDPKLM